MSSIYALTGDLTLYNEEPKATLHRTCTDVRAGKLLVVCEECGCLRQSDLEHAKRLKWVKKPEVG